MKDKILEYVKELEKRESERLAKMGLTRIKYVFGVDFNTKFARVWYENGSQRFVFCFIDYDGNIYKPSGWKAPAKGVRATLDNPVYTYSELYIRK